MQRWWRWRQRQRQHQHRCRISAANKQMKSNNRWKMWDMRTKNTLCFNTKWFVTIILKTMHKNFEYQIACERQHETMCTEQNRANEQSFPTTWMQPCFFFSIRLILSFSVCCCSVVPKLSVFHVRFHFWHVFTNSTEWQDLPCQLLLFPTWTTPTIQTKQYTNIYKPLT